MECFSKNPKFSKKIQIPSSSLSKDSKSKSTWYSRPPCLTKSRTSNMCLMPNENLTLINLLLIQLISFDSKPPISSKTAQTCSGLVRHSTLIIELKE